MTLTDANAAKADAMAQVEANANEDWMHMMEELVRQVAQTQQTFTSDDVFALRDEYDGPTTHDTRAFGPVMARAAKAGVCRRTDRTTPSRRVSCHKRPLAIWTSLVFKP